VRSAKPRSPALKPAIRQETKKAVMPAIAYHCQAKPHSRSAGKSAVAAVAYRVGQKLEDERYGKTQDYSRKQGVEFVWHAAPVDAPAWAHDIGQVWNEVERVENRKNSTLAREYEVSFPHQLDAEARAWMIKDFVREEFTRKDLISTSAIHAPGREGDERNYHAHIMVSERPVGAEGWAKNKDRSFSFDDKGAMLEHVKEKWAELGARQLARAGHPLEAERWRHGHKTLRQQEAAALERGDIEYAEALKGREPTQHVGVKAVSMERDGRESHRGRENREIEAANVERQERRQEIAAVDRELSGIKAELESLYQAAPEAEPRPVRPEAEPTAPAWTARRLEKEIGRDQERIEKRLERIEKRWQEQAREPKPLSATMQQINASWAAGDSGAAFVAALEEQGLLVARVSAAEAEQSQRKKVLFGKKIFLREGDIYAVNASGQAYGINEITIGKTAATAFDHWRNVDGRLAEIRAKGAELLTLEQAQEVAAHQAHDDDRKGGIGAWALEQLRRLQSGQRHGETINNPPSKEAGMGLSDRLQHEFESIMAAPFDFIFGAGPDGSTLEQTYNDPDKQNPDIIINAAEMELNAGNVNVNLNAPEEIKVAEPVIDQTAEQNAAWEAAQQRAQEQSLDRDYDRER
jgi:MobA/MobL family